MNKQTKFLYGAAVQGIQDFIFQTNELKDIVGASALVEYICTECFDEFAQGGEMIVRAAGNIKCLFDDEASCRRAVREFPKKVMTEAPGITISEAVVRIDDGDDFSTKVEELELRLRAQRNRPFPSVTTGLMGMERSRKTGLPAVEYIKDVPVDKGTLLKRGYRGEKLFKKFYGEHIDSRYFPWNVGEMTTDNSWLAIIHADGNGLGEIISKIGKDKDRLMEFSQKLDEATMLSAQEAYSLCVMDEDFNSDAPVIPFRPVVLSGDDHTLICRADLAVAYTCRFIEAFEKNTAKMIKDLRSHGHKIEMDSLTACAGIAFIKESYPFHYGYQLAERLCDSAKVDAKSGGITPAPSCLKFHKVQSSFVENYREIVRKELTPCPGHSFEFGPYYIHEQKDRWTVRRLLEEVSKLKGKEGNAVKSDIRQWMSLMSDGPEKAEQKKKRVTTVSGNRERQLFDAATTSCDRGQVKAYPAYDMLSLHSILSLQTKKKNPNKSSI